MSTPEPVRFRDEDRVRWIVLDRPESKNGLTVEVNAKLKAAIQEGAERRDVRALVLTGANGNFCSGLDLKAAMQSGQGPNLEKDARDYFHGLIRAIRACPKPVVGLVDGAAAGFGCDLALACDLRIGTERTRFGEVFVKRGLMPDGGGTWFLPRLVGVGRALELMLLGTMVNAEDALRLGLANRVVPAAEFDAAARDFLATLAAGPPLVQRAVKRAVNDALTSDLDHALDAELRTQLKLLRSRDFFEGVSAFFQKREPKFTGE